MGFEYSDLWLDKNWYIAFQGALAEWRQEDAGQCGDEDQSAALPGRRWRVRIMRGPGTGHC